MKTVMLSVDPGTRGCGIAWWSDKKLAGASYIGNPVEEGSGPAECASMALAIRDWWLGEALHMLALEIPQLYQRAAGKSKGDPNKIMPLFGIGTALAALFPSAKIVYGVPHAWKGGVSKPKTTKTIYAIKPRVLDRLSCEEQALIAWPVSVKKEWDVIDALGIGLYHLGRFERHRVFARE